MKKILFLLFLSTLSFCLTAQTTTIIPAVQWQSAFRTVLGTMELSFNNYTPNGFQDTNSNTFRYYKRNGCRFKIGFGARTLTQQFTLLPFRAEPMTIYLSNISISRKQLMVRNGKLIIRLFFEDRDLEVRTNCIENLTCGAIGNPNFNIANPSITIELNPIISYGKIAYTDNVVVKLNGTLQHHGLNLTVATIQELIKMFNFDANSFIQEEGSERIAEYINSHSVIEQIREGLHQALTTGSSLGFTLPPNMESIQILPNGDMKIFHR